MVMGTQVQHTGYLQNFHTKGDLKDDANGSMLQYLDHQSLVKSMNIENKLMPSSCLNYDKELFRRTILEHEAVFRKQVYELHRLYKKQKELMDELKKTPCKPLQSHTSDSHILSSQTNILDFNNNGLKMKTFDLELPTEVNVNRNEKGTPKDIATEPSLVAAVSVDKTQNLADLNEPMKEICFGEVFEPVSSKFGDSNAENTDILFKARSCAMNDYSKSICYDEGTSSNKLHLRVENNITNWERSSLCDEAGQIMGNKKPHGLSSYMERYPTSVPNLHLNKISHGIPPLGQNKIDSWFRPNLQNIGKKPNNGPIINSLLNSQLGVDAYTQFSINGKFSGSMHSQTRDRNDPISYPNGLNSSLIGYTDVRLNHALLNGFLIGSKTQKIHEPGESALIQNQEASDVQNNKKIFGFCISETVHAKCEDKIETNHLKLEDHIDLNIDLNSTMNFDDVDDDDKSTRSPIPVHENEDDYKVKEAAENILLMPSDKPCRSIGHSSSIASTLLWFADVVTSSDADQEPVDASLDSFELMTLELEETKLDNDSLHAFKMDFQNDEDGMGKDIDLLFFDKTKSGQGRKRRQKSDFQKDVLPSIASLSRKEVSEDIQTIVGSLKAVGKCWEGQNGNSRVRVGRRSKVDVSPLLLPEKNKKSNVIELRWRTRRCRRQRVAPVTSGVAP